MRRPAGTSRIGCSLVAEAARIMSGKRMLLVEDDAALAELVAFHFERAGFAVTRTGDGEEALILVNDPGFHAGDAELFSGKKMTYYGRWTYKYEEAARQGAAAALIIHDDSGAGYGWDVVKNSWSGAQYDLPASADPEPRLPMQGWITAAQARSMLADLGQDLDDPPGYGGGGAQTWGLNISRNIRISRSNTSSRRYSSATPSVLLDALVEPSTVAADTKPSPAIVNFMTTLPPSGGSAVRRLS